MVEGMDELLRLASEGGVVLITIVVLTLLIILLHKTVLNPFMGQFLESSRNLHEAADANVRAASINKELQRLQERELEKIRSIHESQADQLGEQVRLTGELAELVDKLEAHNAD